MTDIRFASRSALALATFATAASAQVLLTTKLGDKANDRFGACVRSAGDVNNDGRPDYIVGAPEDGNVLGSGEGFARVFSGLTGATLYTVNGTTNNDRFGTWVDGAGDVNNDGFADFVVGAPQVSTLGNNRGRVTVYSGANAAVLWTFDGTVNQDKLGTIVAGLGDVNGDGRSDVLTASREAPGGGTQRGIVRVYSGQTGAILHTLSGSANGERLGLAADSMGDVNGDSRADFVVSSLTAGVKVYNGSTGAVLYTLTAPSPDDLFGASVASIADLTGDGVRDLLVGATQDTNIFVQGVGYVRLYNGATGAFVRTHTGSTVGDRFGITCGDGGDLNGDGKSEILVGADQFNNGLKGFVRVFDGATGTALTTLLGTNNGDRFGTSVDGLGDVNGQPGLEIGIGGPDNQTAFVFQGRAEVWTMALSGNCPTPYNYCGSANNSTGQPALISNTGTVSIAANNFTLVCSGLPPSTNGLFYYGGTEIQQTFGNGYRCVGGTVFRLGVQQASPGGVMTRLLNFPSLGGMGTINSGSTWKFQCWYRNPAAGGAGFNLSNGLSATFCN
ncbi:MAG: integrin alpha [Planctomycetota bacterium]|nr:integrin alpha [Planctomycetota bacterium]